MRIHEADGTPYEHVLDIRSAQKHYEVMFNTKYKRVRRNTKRYASRKAAAQAAAAGDQEAAEDIGLLEDVFGSSLWDDEAERLKWKVADWTEEDEQRMSGATYEWIRMDADFEWIGDVAFDQPDFMWVSQLQRDRDVVAQLQVRFRETRPWVAFGQLGADVCLVLGLARSRQATVSYHVELPDARGPDTSVFLPRSDGGRDAPDQSELKLCS